jgi:hypothetical protein
MRILSALVACAGCSHNVYTPPARAFPLETPRTLPAGAYGIAIEGSAHGENPSIGAGTVRVRRGIVENVEASAEVTYARVSDETAADTNPSLFAARAGARLRPDELQSVGVTAGLGAGTFAGGPFVTADAGATLAYDTCRLTPFVGGGAFVSQPLDARDVDTTRPGEPVGTHVDVPETTAGVQVRVGVSLNLASCERRSAAVIVGVGLDHYWDDDDDRGLASGGAALQLDLD